MEGDGAAIEVEGEGGLHAGSGGVLLGGAGERALEPGVAFGVEQDLVALLEVGDGVAAPLPGEDEAVMAGAARERVVATAADERVIARPPSKMFAWSTPSAARMMSSFCVALTLTTSAPSDSFNDPSKRHHTPAPAPPTTTSFAASPSPKTTVPASRSTTAASSSPSPASLAISRAPNTTPQSAPKRS